MQVTSGGENLGCPEYVPTLHRLNKSTVEGPQNRAKLMVLTQRRSGFEQGSCQSSRLVLNSIWHRVFQEGVQRVRIHGFNRTGKGSCINIRRTTRLRHRQ